MFNHANQLIRKTRSAVSIYDVGDGGELVEEIKHSQATRS